MSVECGTKWRIVSLEVEIKLFRRNNLLVDDETGMEISFNRWFIIEACVVTLGNNNKANGWHWPIKTSGQNLTCFSDLGKLLLSDFSILTLANVITIEKDVPRQSTFLLHEAPQSL
jgi:hypothetical protein